MGDDDCMSGAKEHAVPWSWIFPNHGATNQIKLHTVWMWCVWDWERERERANSQANIPTTQLLLAYHIVDLGCWEDCFALMKCLSYDTIISDGEKIVEWNCVGFLLLLYVVWLIVCLLVALLMAERRGWAGLRSGWMHSFWFVNWPW